MAGIESANFSRATPSGLTAEDILDTLEEVISSGNALTAMLTRPLCRSESSDITPFALRAIHAAGRRGLSQTDLARALHRSAPSTTRLVDYLETQQLVVRQAHPSDRRINMIHLSASGKVTLDQMLAKALTFGLALFSGESRTSIESFRSKLCHIATISNES